MPDKINFIFKLDGKNLEEGLNAFDLAQLLTSAGNLIQESFKTLYPDSPEIVVRVKPFKKGSFLIDFLLQLSEMTPIILGAIGPEGIKQISKTLENIGFISGKAISLLKLIEKLNGKPKSIIPQKNGNYNYINKEGEQIVVNGDVNTLMQNPTIHIEIKNTISRPFKEPSVEKIGTFIAGQEKETKIETNRENAEKIQNFSPQTENEEEKTLESESVILLHPKRMDLEGDGKKWSFREPGGNVIVASIKDKGFLEDILNEKIRLGHNDILKVRLLKRQQVSPEGEGSTTNEIIEVIKYTKGSNPHEQSSFLDE